MLKLKLQYFGYLMRRTDSLEKILMLGKIEGGRRRGQQRMRWSDGITNSTDMNLSKPWELVLDREAGVLQSMGSQRAGQDWVTELNRTIIIKRHKLEMNKRYPENTQIIWYIKNYIRKHLHYVSLNYLLILCNIDKAIPDILRFYGG